ncbi:MAG: insulinase family protein [Chitinophagaceae bacterium]|nr:insulinase family protein [Chitinophagaceae bacterium]
MPTLKSSLLLSTFFAFAVTGYGQKKFEWKEATANGYTYRYVSNDPMKARFYTLKNGLTAILSPNKKEPRIKTLIGVRAGSNSDPKDHTGLAHYLEHLLFKGTYKFGSLDSAKEQPYIQKITGLYDIYNHTTDGGQRKTIYHQIDSVSGIAAKYAIPNEYDKMLTSMGAQGTNAHTSVEETVYEEDIPSNSLDKFLAVQSERFSNPVFRLFHTELEAVYEEKNRGLDNDGRKVWESLLSALFPTHNYGQQTTIGTIEHLKNPSLIAIRNFYNTYYVPGNMAIVMAGDMDPDQVIKKIDKAFSVLPAKPVIVYNGPKEAALTAPVIKEVVGPDAENISIGFRLPGIDDRKDEVILTVVSQLLSNGKAGLMDINLNKQQKVLSSNADELDWKDYTILLLSGKAKDGQSLEEVKDLLLAQLELLRKGSFDETLIKAIISNYKLAELAGLESNDNRATSLMTGFIQHRGEDWKSDVGYIDEMARVTKQQVIDYVKKYLNNNYVVVYKRKGVTPSVEKVEKPPITPIPLNRDIQSDFVKYVASIPANALQPQWLDFDKQIGKSKVGNADVLYVQNKDNDLFRLYYRFDIGSYNDRNLGLAAGYLQFLGDDKNTSEQISRQFYNIACNFTVTPGNENTMITISGLQENFGKAVKLFENLVLKCKPDEEALKNLKARLLKSRADAKANKQNIARGLVSYAIYGEKNPFNYQISSDELNAVTSSKLVDILHNIFKYRHTIIYYGPQKLDAFVKDIKVAHAVPAEFLEAPEAVKFEKKDNTKNRVLFTPYDMVQVEITWVNNSVKYDTARLPVIELFNSYFGGDMASVVFQTIRESKALAYSTYAFYAAPDKKDGRFTTVAYVGSQADKMNEAITAMNQLLDTLPRTEDVLANGKQSIRQGIASERLTQDAVIFKYLAAKRLGVETDIRRKVYETVGSLTFDDLKKFHDEELAKKPYTYCVLSSATKINMDDLKNLGELKQVSLEEIFGY